MTAAVAEGRVLRAPTWGLWDVLIGMVGAVAMARRRIPVSAADALAPPDERPLGRDGREAAPFAPELKKV